jgi:hypothetical protein
MLIRAWLFGDKYLMPTLQNKAMSTLIEKNTRTDIIPTGQLKYIYENTLPGSTLRKFIVDMVAYKTDMVDIMKIQGGNQWSHEALVDLVQVVGAKKKEDFGLYRLPEANEAKCYYHIHLDGENCDT